MKLSTSVLSVFVIVGSGAVTAPPVTAVVDASKVQLARVTTGTSGDVVAEGEPVGMDVAEEDVVDAGVPVEETPIVGVVDAEALELEVPEEEAVDEVEEVTVAVCDGGT